MKALAILLLALPLTQDQPKVLTPSLELRAKDIVAILADFNVKHEDQQPFFQPAYGVTDFSAKPPSIWIFNTGDTMTRRSTIIHEMIHIRYHQLGLDPPEEFVNAEEARIYLEMFGAEQ